MKIFFNKQMVAENISTLVDLESLLTSEVTFLTSQYPQFMSWISNKILPGIVRGERTVVVETRSGVIAGFMILKHTHHEKKICTLRVNTGFQNSILPIKMFETGFEVLQTTKPLLSVSEITKPRFERIFEYFGFSETEKYMDLYIQGITETSYNGLLVDDLILSRIVNVQPFFTFKSQQLTKNYIYR